MLYYAGQAPATAQSTSLQLVVTPVDATTVHVVAYPEGSAPPSASPFVVKAAKGAGRPVKIGVDGRVALPRAFPGAVVAESDGTITLTLLHGSSERLYGAGNLDRDKSGSLMHPSGAQIVGNGVTRVPFLWSTGGWSALIANDELGIRWQDEAGKLTFSVPGRSLDLYLSTAKDGYGLLDAYSRLTGRAPIPPRWTLGFLMSRWGYSGAADVQDKWHQFRDRKIPVDAFIYDYDWFQNDWEFNPKNFPVGSLDAMKALGLRFVGIRKPRVNDANKDYAQSQGWTMRSPQGTDLKFEIPAAREWWWSKQLPQWQAGVDAWWNDEAEQTYNEALHMAQSEYEGGRKAGDRRVWNLNRSFAPGIPRYGAALWTGDIDSNWETMANQPGTILNWGLAGNPFVGQDLGGFIGQPSPELYARWVEQGVFQPIMRAHGMLNLDRWPWAFGDDVLAATKKAIELRTRLIPYLYTLAEGASRTGAPMVRPLFMEFPNDERTFDLRDEWLLGDRVLAAPVLTQANARDVVLPAGRWYDFNTGAAVEGGGTRHVDAPLDAIPAFIRAGTILPLGPVVQSTSLPQDGSLEVRVYPGADAAFTLYEDDGDTYAYEKGAASRIPFRWDDRRQTLTIGARKGSYPSMFATRRLTVAVPGGTSRTLTYTDGETKVSLASEVPQAVRDFAAKPNVFQSRAYVPKALPTFEASRASLPQPVVADHPEWVDLYWKAWEIAFSNLKQPEPQSGFISNFIDPAYNGNTFQWDTLFMLQFAHYAEPTFHAIGSLDNFYKKEHADGYICREISRSTGEDFVFGGIDNSVNPPLFSWVEWQNYLLTGDKSRFRDVLPPLVKHYLWLQANRRRENGLYWNTGLGAGEDDLARNASADSWVDMTAQQAQNAYFIARIAKQIGEKRVAAYFDEENKTLSDRVNGAMWTPSTGFYYDLKRDGTPTGIKTVLGFWPLVAHIASKEQAASLTRHLQDPKEFWRPNVVPALAADEKGYVPDGQYWNGAVWAPTNYVVVKGLEDYGYEELATRVTSVYLANMSEVLQTSGTIWENYAPESATGHGVRNMVGWSGDGPIALLIENELGIRAFAANRKATWRPRLAGENGLGNLTVGSAHLSLMASAIENGARTLTMTVDQPWTVTVDTGVGKPQTFRLKKGTTVVKRPAVGESTSR